MGRMSQVRSFTPNFRILAFKMWATGIEIAKIAIFWYNFAKEGYTLLCDFYKICLGGGSLRSAPSCQISPLWLKNMGLHPQNRQNWYFWYKFAQKGYTPLCDFYKIWLGEGCPRSATSRQISPLCL